ncbi:MAG TPA: branched-chain amino acid ABC transporter permease [Microbacteriaceae bacterium]|nr:branched-chain amino acid ABC transporter permease [Microbacteriaceae bacterium]
MSRNTKLRLRLTALAAVLAAAIAFPAVFSSASSLNVAVLTLMYVGLATSWNIVGGYTGYISLGHAAFFGLGAYGLGLTIEHLGIHGGMTPFLLVPAIGVVVGVLAIPVGWIAFRTRQAAFAIVTIAGMFMVQILATNLTTLTHGSQGLGFPVPPWSGQYFDKPFYYAMLVLAVLAILVSWAIRRSSFGLGLLAIRDDEDKAQSVGVPTAFYKLAAFALSAGLVAMIGGVYGYYVTYVYPQFAVDPLISIAIVLMAWLGGAGTLLGPVIGALILEPAQLELSYSVSNTQLYLVFYAAIFLVIILVLPKGIVPSLSERISSRRARREGPPPARAKPEIASPEATSP